MASKASATARQRADTGISSRDAARIPLAVPALMMADSRRDDIVHGRKMPDHLNGIVYMFLHLVVFIAGQILGFV